MKVEEKLRSKCFSCEDYPLDNVVSLEDAIAICKEALRKQKKSCSKVFYKMTTTHSPWDEVEICILHAPEPEDL